MSSTGVPLATLLSSHYRKRLLITDAGAEFDFPPGLEPRTDEAVLLVDSNLSSGDHLDRCSRRIRKAGAVVMGVVLICEDDLPGKERLPIVEEFRTGDRLIPLFTLSDIYRLFQEKKKAAMR
jgi:orotate phosphoribosyltransferase